MLRAGRKSDDTQNKANENTKFCGWSVEGNKSPFSDAHSVEITACRKTPFLLKKSSSKGGSINLKMVLDFAMVGFQFIHQINDESREF